MCRSVIVRRDMCILPLACMTISYRLKLLVVSNPIISGTIIPPQQIGFIEGVMNKLVKERGRRALRNFGLKHYYARMWKLCAQQNLAKRRRIAEFDPGYEDVKTMLACANLSRPQNNYWPLVDSQHAPWKSYPKGTCDILRANLLDREPARRFIALKAVFILFVCRSSSTDTSLSNEFHEPVEAPQKATRRTRATTIKSKLSVSSKSMAVDRRHTNHKWQKRKPRDKKGPPSEDMKSMKLNSFELAMRREEVMTILNEMVISDEETRNRIFAGIVLGEWFRTRRKGTLLFNPNCGPSPDFGIPFHSFSDPLSGVFINLKFMLAIRDAWLEALLL
jgi:hypothetical protein